MSSNDRSRMEALVDTMGVNFANRSFEEFLAEDVVFTHWRWRGQILTGRKAVSENYFDSLMHAFPDLDFKVVEPLYADNTLVVRGEFNATFTNDWGSARAHGGPVQWEAVDIYRFTDGLATRVWYMNDTLRAARAVGVVPDTGEIIGHNPFA